MHKLADTEDLKTLARRISLVENSTPGYEQLLEQLPVQRQYPRGRYYRPARRRKKHPC